MFFSVFAVALLAEGVDRNYSLFSARAPVRVALLAEGVDRNASSNARPAEGEKVALLAEGVDRNVTFTVKNVPGAESPSSRRAWIEIACHQRR